MRQPRRRQQERDREVAFNTERFLQGRLNDRVALLWAADLGPDQDAERQAVRSILEFPRQAVEEPYSTAWRCVVESWKADRLDPDLKAIDIREQLLSGVHPGLLLDDVVRLVAPQLVIEMSGLWEARRRRRARHATDILHLRMTGSRIVGLAEVGLATVDDAQILAELVDRLEAALILALHWSRRLGPDASWSVNWIARVYPPPPVAVEEDDDDGGDPDRHRGGFAPVARLISESLAALAELDPVAAAKRVQRLELLDWPLTRRLWAAAARHPDLADGGQIGRWLLALDDDWFWNNGRYPEVAELRARRFGHLGTEQQQAIEARLRGRPPAVRYRRRLDRDVRERLRDEHAADELRRIAAAGHVLSASSQRWLTTRSTGPGVHVAGGVEDGLFETDRYVPPEPAPYTTEEGGALIQQLESDLSGRLYIEGRPAMDYVTVNADKVFELVQTQAAPHAYPRVWAALASAARDQWIGIAPESPEWAEQQPRAEALLAALAAQPPGALDKAIDGVSYWIDGTAKVLGTDDRYRRLWLTLWPAAVVETNRDYPKSDDDKLVVFDDDGDNDDLASAALNSSAGRMMSAFLAMLPKRSENATPFADARLAELREAVLQADGAARRQALYRLLMGLGYMRAVDQVWADQHLVAPLTEGTGGDPRLWEAISRIGLLPHDTLQIIGPDMARTARETRLPQEVRARLAERLVLPILHDLARDRAPSVSLVEIQQMLRLGGDAVRTRSASALVQFLENREEDLAALYGRSVRRLLLEAWPLDRAALSPALSDALAALPAATGTAFSQAVGDIDGLLIPFDAWSLWDYGLYGKKQPDGRILLYPNTVDEAAALLKLLDRTVGEEEGAIVPRDIDAALQKIAELAPNLAQERAFARLLSLARR